MCKLQAKTQERRIRLKEHQSKQKEQLQHCQQLRTKLQVLRLSKQEQERIQQKTKEEEQKRLDILKVKRQKSFRLRQRAQWAEIKSYRRNQEEIKAERRFHLHQELKATVKRRRQQALQVKYYCTIDPDTDTKTFQPFFTQARTLPGKTCENFCIPEFHSRPKN